MPQQSHAGVFSKVDVERMSDTGVRSVNTCSLIVNISFSWSITSTGPYFQIIISITHASAWSNQNCGGEYAAMKMCFGMFGKQQGRNFIEFSFVVSRTLFWIDLSRRPNFMDSVPCDYTSFLVRQLSLLVFLKQTCRPPVCQLKCTILFWLPWRHLGSSDQEKRNRYVFSQIKEWFRGDHHDKKSSADSWSEKRKIK